MPKMRLGSAVEPASEVTGIEQVLVASMAGARRSRALEQRALGLGALRGGLDDEPGLGQRAARAWRSRRPCRPRLAGPSLRQRASPS